MATQNRAGSIRPLECPKGAEYDEETFRYFLAIEHARAVRSRYTLPLLLAALEPTPGQSIPFPRAGASRLFKVLRASLRDTDVMGWYRQDHVAGAVLSAGTPTDESTAAVERRVEEGLKRELPQRLAKCLRVRVVTHEPKPSPFTRND